MKIKITLKNTVSGEPLSLTDGYIIGRSEGNKTFPKDKLLSRQHCSFSIVDKIAFVEDLGSTNKTYLNKKEIQAKHKYELKNGDILKIGEQSFEIKLELNEEKPSLQIERFVTNDAANSSQNSLDEMEDLSPSNIVMSSDETGENALIEIDTKRASAWFLQVDGSEIGPLSLTEVRSMIQSGKFSGEAFIWQEQLENWTPISKIKNLLPQQKPSPGKPTDDPNDSELRVPLVATVSFTLKSKPRKAVCKDIGLLNIFVRYQEDLDEIPKNLALELFPLAASGLDHFIVDVEITEKKRGQGFLAYFVNLNLKTKAAIDRYVQKKK